jgi:hypothetical protein
MSKLVSRIIGWGILTLLASLGLSLVITAEGIGRTLSALGLSFLVSGVVILAIHLITKD